MIKITIPNNNIRERKIYKGISIEDGAVIGAGSVVIKDVNAIVVVKKIIL